MRKKEDRWRDPLAKFSSSSRKNNQQNQQQDQQLNQQQDQNQSQYQNQQHQQQNYLDPRAQALKQKKEHLEKTKALNKQKAKEGARQKVHGIVRPGEQMMNSFLGGPGSEKDALAAVHLAKEGIVGLGNAAVGIGKLFKSGVKHLLLKKEEKAHKNQTKNYTKDLITTNNQKQQTLQVNNQQTQNVSKKINSNKIKKTLKN